jgi:3-oxoacyl-[acyl-carrier protein] reductase
LEGTPTRQAVVSGGGTGMGKAIAARLVADGYHVVITGRRPEVLEAATAELSAAAPAMISWHPADLTRPHDVERLASLVAGEVAVLVNNAGGVASRGMPGAELADVARAYRVLR